MLLVVDNDSLTMRPWISMLREEGYEVELRNHVDRALNDAANLTNLSCLIVDVMMPSPPEWAAESQVGMATGLVLARELRKRRPQLPVIFLTGQTNQAIIAKLKAFDQPSGYLNKRTLKDDTWISEILRLAGPPDLKNAPAPSPQVLQTA